MKTTVLVAGATGAIGVCLVAMLVERGHRVFGLTRSPHRVERLLELGAVPLVGDVLDAARLQRLLVRAAVAARARLMVAQSIAFAYAPGPQPHGADSPLDLDATGLRGITVGAVAALEQGVLQTPPLVGIVLRYGQLYGPGSGSDAPGQARVPLHVDDAARAAILAIEHGRPGVFNIVEPSPAVSASRAHAELGWAASVRPP